MDYGAFNRYFDSAVAKVLSNVDVSSNKSHQHEFNGTAPLRKVFGDDDIQKMPTTFMYLADDEEPLYDHGFTTWYDARRKHPTRTEYRLYYNDNAAIESAVAGDLMVIALSDDKGLLVLFAQKASTIESQIRWLFGLNEAGEAGFSLSKAEASRITSTAARILDLLGIEVDVPVAAEQYLDEMIELFNDSFPKGVVFSKHAMGTLGELDWQGDPDGCLLACYEREELLFRVFERHLLERDLSACLSGGTFDVDQILRTTMSTFQRRKSRAGTAFENQIAALLDARHISYSAQAYTEGKSKPDFIFPSIDAYHDPDFPTASLTMLGAKTTIKERWRQVLDEANRIERKHLITLEPAVSTDYTAAMEKDGLQLVVPQQIFSTYASEQQNWLMNVADFCKLVENRQRAH